jgi:archaellum biogenesis ATPase FlaH
MLMALDERAQSDLDGDLFDAGGAQLTDHDAERQMLGILLTNPAATTETIEIVKPHDLHDPIHRRLYELLTRAYETDTEITIGGLVSDLGGNVTPALTETTSAYLARLMADADMKADVAEIADHLQAVSERRAVGTVDDVDFDRGRPFVSKFGAQAWEDIGTAGAAVCYAWLVEDVIPLGEITLAFGDSGTGKSFDMFDMAMCVARGIKFNNRNVERGLVVYVAAEAGKGFAKRKMAYAIQHNLEPSEPLPFVLLTKRPNFFHDDTDALALIEEINAIARRYNLPLVLIVIDTLSALAPGMNENASQDVSMVRKRLVMLQDKFNAATVLVHHKPKNGATPRGHGSLTADFETTIEFETVGDRRTDLGKTIHRASVRKQREGKSGIYWEFTLPVVEVGRNKWGNPETSCVVSPHAINTARAAIGFHATANEKLFLRALFDALAEHGQLPPANLPASIVKVVDHVHVRTLMRERVIDPHEDKTVADNRFRGAYKRAGDKLRDGAVIGIQGRLLWYTGKPINGFNGPMIETG